MSKEKILERFANLSPEKRKILEARLRKKDSSKFDNHRISQVGNEKDTSLLSYSQERLWIFDQFEPESIACSIPMVFKIAGPLNSLALEASINQLVHRHDGLRASFYADKEGNPRQRISTPDSFTLPIIVLDELDEQSRMQQASKLMTEEAHTPFSLETGPLARFTLLRLTKQQHWLLVTFHHIIADGWSIGIFEQELIKLYAAYSRGEQNVLPPLPIQYSDFVHWQRQAYTAGQLDNQLAYWKRQLADSRSALYIPTDRPQSLSQSYHGAGHSVILSSELTKDLERLSLEQNVTLFMCLLAVFQVLLFRYSGQGDILVGSPVAGRTRVETEGIIGCFINTIVLRANLSANLTFNQLLKHVRNMVLSGYDHQDLSFEKLVQEMRLVRDLSASPLFEVMFNFDQSIPAVIDLEGLTISHEYCDTGIVLFELGLSIRSVGQSLECEFDYNADLFSSSTIERLGANWQQFLENIVANPEQPIGQLSLLREDDGQQILVERIQAEPKCEVELTVSQLVEQQAIQTPEAVAVVSAGEEFSYEALNRQANQVAHYLRKQGVGPDVPVGLFMARSWEMLVGLLGILKAGGAYVPLDPIYPRERLAFIFSDVQARLLVTQSSLNEQLPESMARVVCLDSDWEKIAQESCDNLSFSMSKESLAYVIYTSGSTGKPKGVEITHEAFVNLLQSMHHELGFAAHDRFLAVTTIAFDIAGLEIFGPLIVGGQVQIVSRDDAMDGRRLIEILQRSHATVLQATPATWQMLIDAGWEGTPGLTMLSGGSVLHRDLARQLLSRGLSLWNGYGPSETTIYSIAYRVLEEKDSIPIGKPIANTQVYVLDESCQIVPVGVSGELYIGGMGLARGYRGRPDLTQEKFIPNPFSPTEGARLYRTGDRARQLSDGTIEFLGRVDFQVKLRGFRIELEEIEAVLRGHPAVQECVVVGERDADDEVAQLVAYVVKTSEGSVGSVGKDFRDFLSKTLPEYMIPAEFVALKAFPLTPNGKIDRAQLPNKGRSLSVEAYVAPRTSLERQLTTIWEEVLKKHPIGIHENYFQLGGHSLKAVQVFSKIEKTIGKALPLSILFKAPTIEQLGQVLMNEKPEKPLTSLVSIQPHGSKAPLFLVHGVGGNVLTYANLSPILGQDQPLYGFQSIGLNSHNVPHERIEDMAAFYIQEMQSVQPRGPYYLGGGCMGGVVALEMAQQLQHKKEEVLFLGLFDTWFPEWSRFSLYSFPRIKFVYKQLWRERESIKEVGIRSWIPHFWKKVQDFQEVVDVGEEYEANDLASNTRALVNAANYNAMRRYVPRSYDGEITQFLASGRDVSPQDDTRMAWVNFACRGFQFFRVMAPNSGQMFVEPYVEPLGRQIKFCIEQVQLRS